MIPPASSESCDLCGLPLTFGPHLMEAPSGTYRFCCMGCRQVFAILMEAAGTADPDSFRKSDLFRECQAAGIIPATEAELAQTVSAGRKAGYRQAPAETLHLTLKIDGMWCPACAWVIEKSVGRLPGVYGPACRFAIDAFQCRYDPLRTDPRRIETQVEKLGYRVRPSPEDPQQAWKRKDFIRFALSLLLTANVMMLSFALYSGFFTTLPPEAVAKISWPIFALATVVVFYGGAPILRKAAAGLVAGAPGMEVLIAIGTLSAYGYSICNLMTGSIHLYFDTAAMLVTLVLLGKTVENQARDRITRGLESFFSLAPTKVRLCSGAFPLGRHVDAARLRVGDRVRIDAGEIVPADGRVVAGRATVDTSSLTGEATPQRCRSGDRIASGTRLLEGGMTMEAERVGEDAILGQMIGIIQRALDSKTPLEGRTDRMLFWFTPLVVFLAAVTGGCWLLRAPVAVALERAVTVLVISCPCALGLAVPLARVAGVALAGRRGLLIREFAAIEAAEGIDTLVLDKTGTLTQGRWRLAALEPTGRRKRAEILAAAAGLEAGAPHPAAHEILQTCRKEGIAAASVTSVRREENGIRGRLDGHALRIGAWAFVNRAPAGGDSGPAASPAGNGLPESSVYLSMDDEVCAVFRFGDRLRPSAAKTVSALKARGIRPVLVSGDDPAATAAAARSAGIEDFHPAALPEDKARIVADLRRRGRRVAMAGDGINDAPALAEADLSIALNTGAPLGRETAHITLLRPDPAGIVEVLDLTRRIRNKIRQNLGFSLVYNLVSIPLAMGGLLTPLVAVTAMLLSSLSVTGNTLLLLRKNIEDATEKETA